MLEVDVIYLFNNLFFLFDLTCQGNRVGLWRGRVVMGRGTAVARRPSHEWLESKPALAGLQLTAQHW